MALTKGTKIDTMNIVFDTINDLVADGLLTFHEEKVLNDYFGGKKVCNIYLVLFSQY
jgi:hypothetical protein